MSTACTIWPLPQRASLAGQSQRDDGTVQSSSSSSSASCSDSNASCSHLSNPVTRKMHLSTKTLNFGSQSQNAAQNTEFFMNCDHLSLPEPVPQIPATKSSSAVFYHHCSFSSSLQLFITAVLLQLKNILHFTLPPSRIICFSAQWLLWFVGPAPQWFCPVWCRRLCEAKCLSPPPGVRCARRWRSPCQCWGVCGSPWSWSLMSASSCPPPAASAWGQKASIMQSPLPCKHQ